MSNDPFATRKPADEDAADAAAEDVVETPAKAPAKAKTPAKKETPTVTTSSEGKIVVSFKGGAGYADPWVVIHADDAQEALDLLSGDEAAITAELLTRTAAVAKYFHDQVGSNPQGSQERTAGKPAGATQEPSGETRSCEHGNMQYRAAKPESGKTWRGFFCPTPKDTPGQCKPVFLK